MIQENECTLTIGVDASRILETILGGPGNHFLGASELNMESILQHTVFSCLIKLSPTIDLTSGDFVRGTWMVYR